MSKYQLIHELCESRIFRSKASIKKFSTSQHNTLFYSILLSTIALALEPKTNTWARKYASTAAAFGNFDYFRPSGNDLYVLTHIAQHVTNSISKAQARNLLRIYKGLARGDVESSFAEQVLIRLERGLGIKEARLRQARRVITHWSNTPDADQKQTVTNLHRLVRLHAKIAEVLPYLLVASKDEPGHFGKMIKSLRDIKKFYEGAPEGFTSKIEAAFINLKKLGIKNVLQGDLMFISDMLSSQNIGGQDYIVFTPNTITYAVEVGSELAGKIERAKFGIVFHTAYEGGATLGQAEKTFDIDISALKKTPDVWYDDATYKDYTGIASLTPEEDEHLRQEIIAAKGRLTELGKAELENITSNPEFKKTIQIFINANVRAGQHIEDSAKFTREFLKFHAERTLKGVEELKPTFQKKRHEKIAAKKDFIATHKESVYKLIDLYNHLNEIKLILIAKLNTIDGMKTFLKSGNGYEVTNPEGFVALGHSGDATKLVNRMEFSQQNFNR